MRNTLRIHVIVFIFAVLTVVSLYCDSIYSDTVTRKDGKTLTGNFYGYEAGIFQFKVGDQIISVPATEVVKIVPDAPDVEALSSSVDQLGQNMALVIQRLDQIEAKLDATAGMQEVQNQNLNQRVFELNPVSRMRIESDSGSFERDGSFQVTGQVRNLSSVTLRYPSVQIELIDNQGNVLVTQPVPLASKAVGPGSSALFRYSFPSPPAFAQYRITPMLEYTTAPPEEATGERSFEPINLENR